jgi:hypothetical protein
MTVRDHSLLLQKRRGFDRNGNSHIKSYPHFTKIEESLNESSQGSL